MEMTFAEKCWGRWRLRDVGLCGGGQGGGGEGDIGDVEGRGHGHPASPSFSPYGAPRSHRPAEADGGGVRGGGH